MASPEEDSPQRILVEGENDLHVVAHIFQKCVSQPTFYIDSKGSVDSLIASIEAEADVDGRKALGIIVDADNTLQSRWVDIKDQLAGVGIIAPSSPDQDGTIIETGNKPRVGIWIMPDNASPGELEDFVCQMIPSADPVWPLSTNYIARIPRRHRKFPNHKVRKAEVYAWLATREHPRPMGMSVQAGDLDVNGSLCQKFVAWLLKLLA